MKQWFVATTKHQQEIRAAGELREQGFEIYLPKRYRLVSTGRRGDIVTGLRFSGYIFMTFDPEKGEYGPINNTRSVGELICGKVVLRDPVTGEILKETMEPTVLRAHPPQRSAAEIEAGIEAPPEVSWYDLQRRYEDEEWEKLTGKAKPDPRADLHHGDIVQIDLKENAFNGHQGEYARTENGLAVVHIGWAICKVPEIHLRLIRRWNAKAVEPA